MSCCVNATNIVALQESMTDVVSAIQKALGKEDDFSRNSIESTLSMCPRACCMYTWMCTHMCTDVCMYSGMIENANRSPVSNCVLCTYACFKLAYGVWSHTRHNMLHLRDRVRVLIGLRHPALPPQFKKLWAKKMISPGIPLNLLWV